MIKILESASEAIVMDDKDKNIVASQIFLNIKGEYDAIEGYNKLIPFLELNNDEEAINDIKEIISDEKNHAMLLNKILLRYDGNIPVAED